MPHPIGAPTADENEGQPLTNGSAGATPQKEENDPRCAIPGSLGSPSPRESLWNGLRRNSRNAGRDSQTSSSTAAETPPAKEANEDDDDDEGYGEDPIVLSEDSMEPEDLLDERIQKINSFGGSFVMRGDSTPRRIWNLILTVLLIYTGTIFPYLLCFQYLGITYLPHNEAGPPTDPWETVEAVVDALFWVDLIINFLFTYEDKRGREVDDFFKIFKNYMQTFFFINLVACMPASAIQGIVELFDSAPMEDGSSTGANANKLARITRLQRLSRLARLVRLARLAKLMKVLKHPIWKALQNLRGVRIMNFTAGLFWAVHLLACGWYLCASMHEDPLETWVGRRTDAQGVELYKKPPLEQWWHAMYFVLTVFTTVGFGDMSATTIGEIAYVSFTMLVGAVVHSIIVSEVINVVTSIDQSALAVSEQRELLAAFAENTDLDEGSRSALSNWIDATRFSSKRDYDREGMRKLLLSGRMPQTLIRHLPKKLFHGKLVKNRFLYVCLSQTLHLPPRFPLLVAISVTPRTFIEEELVYQLYDQPFNVFLVMTGTFACIAQATPQGGLNVVPNLKNPIIEGLEGSTPGLMKKARTKVLVAPTSTISLVRTTSALLTGQEDPTTKDKDKETTASGGLTSDASASLGDFLMKRTSQANLGKPLPKTGIEEILEEQDTKTARMSPYLLYGPRNYFGDYELLVPGPRKTSLRCESKTGTLLVLFKADLFRLMDEFPTFGDQWRDAARRKELQRQTSFANLTKSRNYRVMAACTIQRYYRQWLETRPRTASEEDMIARGGSVSSLRSSASAGGKRMKTYMMQKSQSNKFTRGTLQALLASARTEEKSRKSTRPATGECPGCEKACTMIRELMVEVQSLRKEIRGDSSREPTIGRVAATPSLRTPFGAAPSLEDPGAARERSPTQATIS
eukprot:TRINITY_DN17735_c0_g1_i1.p1 TRINITY_DN17735_c0_g1~~TRINITY_DN17735_c0_g1_i1.p1  ORF type:complete len:915 (-),score=186.35 TRINITY_DN17735_c0_g1_i1:119-2863(-)